MKYSKWSYTLVYFGNSFSVWHVNIISVKIAKRSSAATTNVIITVIPISHKRPSWAQDTRFKKKIKRCNAGLDISKKLKWKKSNCKYLRYVIFKTKKNVNPELKPIQITIVKNTGINKILGISWTITLRCDEACRNFNICVAMWKCLNE